MWLVLALLVATSEAGKDIFHSQKRVRPLSPVLKAWAITTTSLPLLGIVLAWKGIPHIQPDFWIYVSIHAVLLGIAFILYMFALQTGPLWQTQPILSLTTVFLTVTNPLLTTDRVSVWGWAGVVVVALGLYGVAHPGRLKDEKTGTTKEAPGFFAPLVEMFRQRGVLAKLGVAVIFSITANLDKLCLERSSGPFYLVVDQALVSVLLGIILIVLKVSGKSLIGPPEKDDTGKVIPVAAPQYLLIGGTINAFTVLMHMWALTFVPVPFVIAVKRISIFLTSLWDYYVRKTRAPRWFNLVGVGMIVGGVAMMLLLGRG